MSKNTFGVGFDPSLETEHTDLVLKRLAEGVNPGWVEISGIRLQVFLLTPDAISPERLTQFENCRRHPICGHLLLDASFFKGLGS